MDFPTGRLAVAALTLGALAGPLQAQQCSHHQMGASPGMSFNMQQMATALQPQMSPMLSSSMTAQASMATMPTGRYGSSSCSMSHMMSMTSPMSQFQLARTGPFPSMQSTSMPTPGWQWQMIALQQQQLVAVQQQQQLVAVQQQQARQQQHQDALLKTEQLRTLRSQMTTLQGRLTALQTAAPDNLRPTVLNELQGQVNALQDQFNGLDKAPKGLAQLMSDLQDQMSSLQRRVTATQADLIAVLRGAAK